MEFPCSDSRCIPVAWLCDGRADCEDGLDEHTDYCHSHKRKNSSCMGNEHECTYGGTWRCIQHHWLCDGHKDCDDASDEEDCSGVVVQPISTNLCGLAEFSCISGGCIPKDLLCDAVIDCMDGSDENCTGGSPEKPVVTSEHEDIVVFEKASTGRPEETVIGPLVPVSTLVKTLKPIGELEVPAPDVVTFSKSLATDIETTVIVEVATPTPEESFIKQEETDAPFKETEDDVLEKNLFLEETTTALSDPETETTTTTSTETTTESSTTETTTETTTVISPTTELTTIPGNTVLSATPDWVFFPETGSPEVVVQRVLEEGSTVIEETTIEDPATVPATEGVISLNSIREAIRIQTGDRLGSSGGGQENSLINPIVPSSETVDHLNNHPEPIVPKSGQNLEILNSLRATATDGPDHQVEATVLSSESSKSPDLIVSNPEIHDHSLNLTDRSEPIAPKTEGSQGPEPSLSTAERPDSIVASSGTVIDSSTHSDSLLASSKQSPDDRDILSVHPNPASLDPSPPPVPPWLKKQIQRPQAIIIPDPNTVVIMVDKAPLPPTLPSDQRKLYTLVPINATVSSSIQTFWDRLLHPRTALIVDPSVKPVHFEKIFPIVPINYEPANSTVTSSVTEL